MKALVTGGAGFIGSNLVDLLLERGFDVVALDDLSLGVPENVSKGAELVDGSVTDLELLTKISSGVDVVFHLAAKSSAPMIEDDPIRGEEVNVGGFLKVLHAARENGVRRVVYASTSSMYSAVKPPHREDVIVVPRTFYEQNFFSREQLARIYSDTFGLETVGMRFFSVYGPKERHKGRYANLVSQFIWAMMRGERPIIYGDGTQTRDFVYVHDVCRALYLAGTVEGVSGEIFNVCTGRNTSLNELVTIISKTLGVDIKPRYVENPIKRYVHHTLGDPTKAREILGFQAEVDLATGVRMLVDQMKD